METLTQAVSALPLHVSIVVYGSTVVVAERWRGLRSSLWTLFLAQCGRKCVTRPLITRHNLLHTHTIYFSTLFFSHSRTHTHTQTRGHTHSIVEKLTGLLLSDRESFRKRVLSNTSVTVKCIWAWKAITTCHWFGGEQRFALSFSCDFSSQFVCFVLYVVSVSSDLFANERHFNAAGPPLISHLSFWFTDTHTPLPAFQHICRHFIRHFDE